MPKRGLAKWPGRQISGVYYNKALGILSGRAVSDVFKDVWMIESRAKDECVSIWSLGDGCDV